MPQSSPSPLVTIVTPCYQQGALLPEAIESALAQTEPRWEMIIINDGSTDDTGAVARRAAETHPGRIQWIEIENGGQARARQLGLDRARGRYLVTLDADDRLAPAMLAECVAALEAAPAAAAAVANAWLTGPDCRTILKTFDQSRVVPWPGVLEYNPYGAVAAIMTRRERVLAVGGLAVEGTPGAEDWDLWVRLARCGEPIVTLGRPLAYYRQGAGNYSRQALRMLCAGIEVLDRAAAPDPRLAGLPAAPPIAPDHYRRLRNARVLYAYGVAVYGGADAPAREAILDRLVPGALAADAAAAQFLWGAQYGLAGGGGAAVETEAVLDALRRGLAARGLDGAAAGRLTREVAATLRDPQRKASLRQRLRTRWSRWRGR